MRILGTFERLLGAGRTTGFVALVRPLSFEEQVEEQRRIRDVAEETEPEHMAPSGRHRRRSTTRPYRCARCGMGGHKRTSCVAAVAAAPGRAA